MEDQIQDYISQIGEIAIDSVPVSDWQSIEILASVVDGYAMLKAWYTTSKQDRTIMFDFDDEDTFEELRKYMAESENQVWYNVTLKINNDGKIELNFDYETPPQIEPFPLDYWFVDEYKKYHRNKDELPKWLYEILDRNISLY